jgi:hypothetical protein
MRFKYFIFLPMLAASLMAEDPASSNPFEFNLNVVIANGDLNRMVRSNNLAGYTLGFGARSELRPGLNTRLHLALMSIRGADKTGLENANRPQTTGGLDIMQDVDKWTFYGGLTATQWKQGPNPTLPAFSGANTTNGVKMGYRIGAEYAFSKNIRANMAFNQAEFNKVLNPSWYSLGLTYRFD